MAKLWSGIVTFNTLYILNLWLQDRTNAALIDSFSPAKNWSEVPIFGIGLGIAILCLSAIIGWEFAAFRRNKQWYERIPSLWLNVSNETISFRKRWFAFVLIVAYLFPAIAFSHFWRRLGKWDAWPNEPDAVPLSPYTYVSPSYLFNFDAHRYGDFSKRLVDGWHGISFVPFWQPLLFALATGIAMVLVACALIAILQRPVPSATDLNEFR